MTEEDLVSVLTALATSPVPTAHAAPEGSTSSASRAEPATDLAPEL